MCRSFIDGRGSGSLSARFSAAGGQRDMDVLICPPPLLLAICRSFKHPRRNVSLFAGRLLTAVVLARSPQGILQQVARETWMS